MGAIFIEEFVLGLLTGNVTVWFMLIAVQLVGLKLGAVAGRATRKRFRKSVGDMADVKENR